MKRFRRHTWAISILAALLFYAALTHRSPQTLAEILQDHPFGWDRLSQATVTEYMGVWPRLHEIREPAAREGLAVDLQHLRLRRTWRRTEGEHVWGETFRVYLEDAGGGALELRTSSGGFITISCWGASGSWRGSYYLVDSDSFRWLYAHLADNPPMPEPYVIRCPNC